MAGNPWNIPGANGKALTTGPPKQAPVPGGNPWHIPGANGQAISTNAPPAPTPPAPPAAAAPPAPPPDYWALSKVDPQYTMGKGLLDRQNTMNMASLNDAWKRQGQQYQDSYNAHGALFSGAAIHAQQYNDQQNQNAIAKQTLGYDQGLNDLRWGVFNRLVQGVASPVVS